MDPIKETREEFEIRYSAGLPGRKFGESLVSMECTCEDGGGPTHWAAISNTPEAIEEHLSHERVLASLREQDSQLNAS